MKKILFDDIYAWSTFNETRQIDFNGHLWVRPEGNVLVDPVPMIESDLAQFDALGGAAWIVITNKDHEREAAFFQKRTGAQIAAHAEDIGAIEVEVNRSLADGDEIVPGLQVIHLPYGKSPGEIALYWSEKKLILAGDLVAGEPMGKFTLLMDEKLKDPPRAALELRRFLSLQFDAILVGDGHSILQNAREHLIQCLEERCDIYINRVNIDEIDWLTRSGRESYACETKDIDPLIGARHLGYQLIRLPKGQSICPLHFHHFGEEMFYVTEGRCALLTPRGEIEVHAGDFIAFPPGPSGAHKFLNRGDEPCVLLALGIHLPHEVGELPDSDKINVIAKGDTDRNIFRLKDAVDYWEGE